ncbi:class I SAM-dependent methyltransferase [Tessaracoccus lacteus]|uniref:Class I SAM-dependent methyltransferase n=1 Tax=Tessaracoccus lacteus TaxID=3041766 RepID=A0ABY8PYV7_9ACTN|nr:class I SAM-dependent methyltransferase [Tessaracoccus sp. T21]WGT47683.1 class I SAM-dependent methyltransferase [Tessaracoccus sp. T21]
MMHDLRARFDHGADHYDLLVSLNPGYHRHLRSAAAELASRLHDVDAPRVLDLACGSGASTRALVDALPAGATVHGIDLSRGMLAQAARHTWPPGVSFEQGRVGNLDTARLGEGSWDAVFASYLFRNIPEAGRDGALAEVARLLKPGGHLITQEYSVAGSPGADRRWTLVSWSIIIPLGSVVDRDPDLYRYLWRSARRFDSPAAFMDRIADAGFRDVRTRTVSGWQRGILHTFAAVRP